MVVTSQRLTAGLESWWHTAAANVLLGGRQGQNIAFGADSGRSGGKIAFGKQHWRNGQTLGCRTAAGHSRQ